MTDEGSNTQLLYDPQDVNLGFQLFNSVAEELIKKFLFRLATAATTTEKLWQWKVLSPFKLL